MKRWRLALLLVFLLGVTILLRHARGANLLQDTDTNVMIRRIEQRGDMWSWFVGDWPLLNHFYRPVVALVFEVDRMVHGWNAAGYGLTNALIAVGCVCALFWLVRELFDTPWIAATTASLFAVWHLGPYAAIPLQQAGWILIVLGLLAVFRSERSLGAVVGAAAIGYVLAFELPNPMPFWGGIMSWIPGRTASIMSLFALTALAAYARYERLSARRDDFASLPTEPPATRSTESRVVKPAWGWVVLSIPCAWLAFSSYEQAVMLPACFFGVAILMRINGYRVRWGWQTLFWGLIPLYLWLRDVLLPEKTSDYQEQQLRAGPDVYFTLTDYLFPAARSGRMLLTSIDLGPLVLFVQWATVATLLAGAVAYFLAGSEVVRSVRQRTRPLGRVLTGRMLLGGWALSFVAFLPMAWLKPFPSYNHYHYFPMAFRTLFLVGLVTLGVQLLIRAWSPRARPTPPRLSPAPGSLPRL